MKREIKFRGIREEYNPAWHQSIFKYGNLLNLNSIGEVGYDLDHYEYAKVKPETVGQFTGLYDKNGKEIYEGDIVTYKRSVGNWTGQTMTTTHKIIFTEEVNAFVMEYGSSYIKLRKHWGYEYEVIGNIFENPDLLQGVL